MFDGEATNLRYPLAGVSTGDSRKALLREHVGDQGLYVEIFAASDDGNDDFNLDTDFSIGIYAGFHTQVCACVWAKCKSQTTLFAVFSCR